MQSRRALLENTLKISAGLALGPASAAFAGAGPPLTLSAGNGAAVRIPANFIGLGYEMSSVATPGLLDVANRRYVDLVEGLGPEGVLRVGGIVADYTRYEPEGTGIAERQNTVITRATLERFAAFLNKVGWSAIWSVNFAQGSLQDAVAEARAVSAILGPRLLALEIGNEVNSYGRGRRPFRKQPYDYETYLAEYREWHAAIVKAVPGIRFAAPDTAGSGSGPSSVAWVERMAKDAKGDVQLLTTHYYRNNQRHGTPEQLLYPDPGLKDALIRLRAASEASGIPWRICETNSFSGGGRPGVSDTFLAALWTLDYMLLLANYGCSGINIETGVNQLGFISSYSPIQDDGKGANMAAAPYYGMLAFAAARSRCPEMLPLDFDARGMNLTAYLLGEGGKPRALVAVNRDPSQDARLSIGKLGFRKATALRLRAPASESTSGLTFAGAAVDEAGNWRAAGEERIHREMVIVPRMSAVVVRAYRPPE